MSAASGTLPNLINGISQQAPALRLPTQMKSQENYYDVVVDGKKDRPPTELKARLTTGTLASNAFVRTINRDNNEKYVYKIDATGVRVWDFLGNEKTVNAPDGYGYLSGVTDPQSQIAALTVVDYTFIVNRNVTVAMGASTSPLRNPEAMIYIRQGVPGLTYQIVINGSLVAQYVVPTTGSVGIDAQAIATALITDLATNGIDGAHGWAIEQLDNVIVIANTSNFLIEARDGNNNQAVKAIEGTVQNFSDLPAKAHDGFTVRVIGDVQENKDDYWVEFDVDSGASGTWRESLAPGTVLGINPAKMPHVLVREADGTFTFKPADWEERTAGNEETSPDPSFVGKTIYDVFFFRNRLGFLTDESVVQSGAGSFFRFFRSTAVTVLDDDPIDVAASDVKVSYLRHAVPFQDDLILFSDNAQFRESGNELFSPKSVSIRTLIGYESNKRVKPIVLGSSIYFSAEAGSWANVYEFVVDSVTKAADASDATSHVPALIPSGVTRLIGDTNQTLLAALTNGDRSRLWIYSYMWGKDTKLQASWSPWHFAGSTILDAEWIDGELLIVLTRTGGTYLVKIRTHAKATDDGLGFLVLLDHRMHSDDAIVTYDADLDLTFVSLPYTIEDGIKAITAPGGATMAGRDVTVVGFHDNAVHLAGDRTADKFWLGYTYDRRFRFSQFFPRDDKGSAIQAGRLQVKYLVLAYSATSYFRVEVTAEGRRTRTRSFTGYKLGSPQAIISAVPLLGGKMSIPILSRSDRVSIDVINDTWRPSQFINAVWSGEHNPKARSL